MPTAVERMQQELREQYARDAGRNAAARKNIRNRKEETGWQEAWTQGFHTFRGSRPVVELKELVSTSIQGATKWTTKCKTDTTWEEFGNGNNPFNRGSSDFFQGDVLITQLDDDDIFERDPLSSNIAPNQPKSRRQEENWATFPQSPHHFQTSGSPFAFGASPSGTTGTHSTASDSFYDHGSAMLNVTAVPITEVIPIQEVTPVLELPTGEGEEDDPPEERETEEPTKSKSSRFRLFGSKKKSHVAVGLPTPEGQTPYQRQKEEEEEAEKKRKATEEKKEEERLRLELERKEQEEERQRKEAERSRPKLEVERARIKEEKARREEQARLDEELRTLREEEELARLREEILQLKEERRQRSIDDTVERGESFENLRTREKDSAVSVQSSSKSNNKKAFYCVGCCVLIIVLLVGLGLGTYFALEASGLFEEEEVVVVVPTAPPTAPPITFSEQLDRDCVAALSGIPLSNEDLYPTVRLNWVMDITMDDRMMGSNRNQAINELTMQVQSQFQAEVALVLTGCKDHNREALSFRILSASVRSVQNVGNCREEGQLNCQRVLVDFFIILKGFGNTLDLINHITTEFSSEVTFYLEEMPLIARTFLIGLFENNVR